MMTEQLKPLSKKLRDALARVTPDPHSAIKGTLRVTAAGEDSVEVLIYGPIGSSLWDDESVSARSVVDALSDIAKGRVHVRINSIGGSVSDGVAIHNELRRLSSQGVTVDVTVDGVACSIASLIAAAGDRVVMYSNALMMLHAPFGGLHIEGNAKDIREVSEEFAKTLDAFGRGMSASYARKSGKPASDFDELWATGQNHWFTAQDATELGLCDEVIDAESSNARDAAATAATDPLAAQLIASVPAELAGRVHAALLATPPEVKVQPAAPAKTGDGVSPAPETNPQATARVNLPAASGVTTGESVMTEEQKQAQANIKAAADKARSEAITALRDRNTEIKAIAEPHFGNADVKAYYDNVVSDADPEITAADVGKQILAMLAKGRGPLGGDVRQTEDEHDLRMTGMGKALQARLGHAKHEDGNQFRGLTLYDMAAECASAAGVNVRGMDRKDVVRAAITHTSSDFPQLTAGAVRTAVLRGYNEFPEVFPDFTRAISVPDFKKQSLAGLGQFIGVAEVPEGDEYKYGTFSEIGQEIQLKKLGGMFSITDEAIINDDLNLFDNVPAKMGAAAKRALGDLVFALITSNVVLADGVALFHATHNNLLTGAVPTTAAIDAMIAKMALQKDSASNPVRVPLKYVLAPVGLGGVVRQILDSQYEIGATKTNTAPNYVRGRFVVIEDPRLDAASTTAYYGVADPAVIDGVVIAYRDGMQEPKVTQKEGWNVDGLEFKVRLDANPGIASYMGLNKNPGA